MILSLLSNESTQLSGLLLWRFGLLLASATAIYRTTKFLLKFIDLPIQLEVGVGFLFAGAVFFVASVIMEQISDGKQNSTEPN